MELLDRHAPLKFKYVRANESPFINKELRKSIMLRSKLKNNFNNKRTETAKIAFKKQRNHCTSLFRKAKREYYRNLNPSKVSDNKLFWKMIKPAFSDKKLSKDHITLIENNEIIFDDIEVAKIFNDYFANAFKSLNISMDPKFISDTSNIQDPVLIAMEKYKIHPSILKIKEAYGNNNDFSFTPITINDMFIEITRVKCSKSSPLFSIPAKILKENIDFLSLILHNNFNNSIFSCYFPDKLKLADVIPSYKKGVRTNKLNYRPVSLLPVVSKIYERLLYYQLDNYFDNKLSKFQCGFRKGYSAQNCLVVMLEKCKKSIDQKGSSGALFTDLSKAFDSIAHDLLIAKLGAYGVDIYSLKIINSYLTNRYQRVKINSQSSRWSEISCGVPQGSVLGPLLFNIYLCDLFLFKTDSIIANYADDNTPYITAKDIESVIKTLETDSISLFQWLSFNVLLANPSKSHMLLSSPNTDLFALIDGNKIFNSKQEKLLGITIDNELTFNDHVAKLCNKASQKLHALTRVAHFMNKSKRRIIMRAFILSQFSYCPLVWMCHSRILNARINRIHERSLRVVYNDYNCTFLELLNLDGSFTVHERNIQTLAIEIYRVINGTSPEIMKEVFPLKSNLKYNSKYIFESRNVHSVHHGTETLSFLGPKIWQIVPHDIKQIVPHDIKQANTLTEFKRKIRKWKPVNCPCRLCKLYVPGVGFIISTS